MNRRRQASSHKTSPVAIISIILAAVIGAAGGVTYVYYKNSQIKTLREIDLVEKRIERHKLEIRTLQMRSDQILNLYAIRKQLEEEGTGLVPIPPGVCEDIFPVRPSAVASVQSNL